MNQICYIVLRRIVISAWNVRITAAMINVEKVIQYRELHESYLMGRMKLQRLCSKNNINLANIFFFPLLRTESEKERREQRTPTPFSLGRIYNP